MGSYFYIAQTMYKLLRHWFCNIYLGLSIYHQSLKIPEKKFDSVNTVYIVQYAVVQCTYQHKYVFQDLYQTDTMYIYLNSKATSITIY